GTNQAPATSPCARVGASMAYDAATSNMVLFGGLNSSSRALGDTWTWNGTTWTKQAPAASPPPGCRVDGLRRGHQQRGPIRRPEQGRRRSRSLVGLGLRQLDTVVCAYWPAPVAPSRSHETHTC